MVSFAQAPLSMQTIYRIRLLFKAISDTVPIQIISPDYILTSELVALSVVQQWSRTFAGSDHGHQRNSVSKGNFSGAVHEGLREGGAV